MTAPVLLAEVIIHIRTSGERMVYASKTEATPEETLMIVQSVVEAGMDMAKQHGINIDFKREGA